MICRLPSDPLHAHALYVLSCSPPTAKSWFQQVRDICLLYSLPHPLVLLQHPPTKLSFKNLVQRNVTEYWENLLWMETLHLSSLIFFNSTQLSLQKPCPLWLSAGSNSYECSKSWLLQRWCLEDIALTTSVDTGHQLTSPGTALKTPAMKWLVT